MNDPDSGLISYLNTDLDLASPDDLTPLATALEVRDFFLMNLWQEEDNFWYARFESSDQFVAADPNIAAMIAVIESLDESEKGMWQNCTLRIFDIGYSCGKKPWPFTQEISAETLQRIAQIGASLQITMYPEEAPNGTETT